MPVVPGMIEALERAVALHRCRVFSGVPVEALLPLAEVATDARFAAGEELCREGEAGDRLWVLAAGRVQVSRGGAAVAELGAGEVVGEVAVVDGGARSATVTAVDDVVCVALERDDVLDVLADWPAVVRALAEVMAARVRG